MSARTAHVRDRARDERAELRARELLRSVAGDEAAAMYEELGFVGVDPSGGEAGYGYLIYPHRPLVAYDSDSGELLNEYCVRFRDGSEPGAGEWLPDADDVLAKWIALNADERLLIDSANMDRPGRQLDPEMIRRDIATLGPWRRDR
ncbi:MAG TPA: hypothetical protein VHH72_02710 [Solirubrobacterales bacterium]|nr:hypothetical protein [Solirubrobacterales bacterium]